jgi:hypothetical protein
MVTHILYPFLLMSLIDDLSTTLSHSPSTFANFSDLIDINWIEKSLEWTGKASIRKRVVWLVIGLALFRGQPIWYVVQQFELVFGASDYCFPGAEVQARQGLGQEHLMDLFLTLSQAWFKDTSANTRAIFSPI